MIWSCPLCKQPLCLGAERRFACADNHSFDMARQGYVNLLPAQFKRSKSPGDDQAMLTARRGFLLAGYYTPLVDALVAIQAEQLPQYSNTKYRALDMGGGDGFFSASLRAAAKAEYDQYQWFLTDISKPAVRMAAPQFEAGYSAVASSFQLPVMDHCLDLILRNFAPSNDTEVARVLRPEGSLIIVAPGPRHLLELRSQLYEKVRPHSPPATPVGMILIEQRQLTYTIEVSGIAERQSLLAMTPMAWRASSEARDNWLLAENPSVTIDFLIQRFELHNA